MSNVAVEVKLREGCAGIDEYVSEILELSPRISNDDLAGEVFGYVVRESAGPEEREQLLAWLKQQMSYYTGRDK